MNICLVIEQGWIIKGERIDESRDTIKLKNASVVRCWKNGKGIGGIAKIENKYEYTLDYIGDVNIFANKVLFAIPCEW